ncbi:PLP-dependent aminotransferase family protein [Microlunatus speluncae]|uniref:MocR-like pyridoxine biosynthesis transcription factor PdxR n=1 Tax=Microlunatus speluncae TaxID=2594267 RepID=UPI00126621BF|nr:PLP-dependent aminotransferase family protein [Microlunatus speluncae]
MADATIAPEDLRLLLGPRTRRGIRAWLHDGIAAAVRDGRLSAGVRLPSSRAVAAGFGVARGPVSEALELLTAEGYLITRERSGSSVAPSAASVRPARREATVRPPPSPGTPDPALFPWSSWLRAMRSGSARLGPDDLGYGDPRGLPALRERVAELLRLTRGAVVEPDQVVIISGVAQGLTLLATVLRARGAGPIAVEDPGSPGARDSLCGIGATVVGVPTDELGIDIDRLADEAGAVIVTPAHQYPLGVPLDPDRRRRLLDWAAGRLVIEDDYDADLRYDGRPIGVLQAMAPDRVVLLGSVSKVLAPGMRLGWLIPPPHLHAELVAAKRNADLGTSVFDQAALAEFLGSGEYQRQVKRLRQVYGERRASLVAQLRERLAPDSFDPDPGGYQAGLHLLVPLPDATAEERALAFLADRGIAAQGYRSCFFGTGDPGIILGIARPIAPTLVSALAAAVHGPTNPRVVRTE